VDGLLYYPDYVHAITEHPIIEMLLSPQFQGTLRQKVLNEDSLTTAIMIVR
jgi:hypothetical protein